MIYVAMDAAVIGMAAVIGVVFGIPTSLLLLAALTRRDRRRLEEWERHRRATERPPVIVKGGRSKPSRLTLLHHLPPASFI